MTWMDVRCPCYDVVRGHLTSMRLFPKTHNPGVITVKHQTNPDWGTFDRTPSQSFLRPSASRNTGRDWRPEEARGPDQRVQCGPWAGSRDTKRTLTGKLVKSKSSLEFG